MATDFETTWVPRIGKEATEELRRARRLAMMWPVAVVLAGGADLLIGNDILADVGGVVCAAAAASILVAFAGAQKQVAAAISRWFGVKVPTGLLPLLNPKRFDAWCERARLQHRAERPDGTPLESFRPKFDHNWGPIHWSGPGRGGERQ